LQALDDARAALSAEKKEIRGKIRVSATSDFGRHVLNPWLDEFTARYPQVVPALLLSDSLSHLIADDVDLVIRFGVPPDSSLIARPLAANRRVLCAAPSYLQRKAPLSIRGSWTSSIILSPASRGGPANGACSVARK
jgi:DNA-binding transcriptional LysR family regulator